MSRLLFCKEGTARYISHLDLMRTMQRIFIRAGLPIRHTEGFNPHPYMNFAMPLSVGTESLCELMDFSLDRETDLTSVPERLNAVSPRGIRARACYEEKRKFKDIKWLDIEARLFYDNKVCRAEDLLAFYAAPSIPIEKRTKRSTATVDIVPLIASLNAEDGEDGAVILRARLSSGEPALSPAQLISALTQRAPDLTPDYAAFKRIEVYDRDMVLFR